MARKKAQANSSEQDQVQQLDWSFLNDANEISPEIEQLCNIAQTGILANLDHIYKRNGDSFKDIYTNGMESFRNEALNSGAKTTKDLDETLNKGESKEFSDNLAAALMLAMNFSNSDQADESKKRAESIISFVENNKEFIKNAFPNNDYLQGLTPYLFESYSELIQNGQYKDLTFFDFLRNCFANGIPESGVFHDAIQKATDQKQTLERALLFADAGKAIEQLLKKTELIAKQQNGRNERAERDKNALLSEAIMELRGDLPIFSSKVLELAFSPENICKLGELDDSYINDETGMICKKEFEKNDLSDDFPIADISARAFLFLSTITANTVENYRENYVKGGKIVFSVDGVMRSLGSNLTREKIKKKGGEIQERKSISRKEANVAFLEDMLKPLLGYVGVMPDGSRYTILNYDGYDSKTGTMAIRTPYLYQLWTLTQRRYFDRIEHNEQATKRKDIDNTPLEVNTMLKANAIHEDDVTIEIALYILNKMLQSGQTKKGERKTTEFKYITIINSCPAFKEKYTAAKNLKGKTKKGKDGKEKPINYQSMINYVLKHFEKAYNLIMNEDKCKAKQYYKFYKFGTTTDSGDFVPPTMKSVNDLLTIEWESINEDS